MAVAKGKGPTSARRGSRASIGMGRRTSRVTGRRSGGVHPMGRTASTRMSAQTGGMGQFSANHRGHGMPHGFVSKRQWRYFFANPKLRAKYAHKEAHKTPGGPKVRYRRLPASKGQGSAARRAVH
jgi:hypothetical protein